MNKTRLSLIAASVILACNTAMAGEHGHGAAHWTYSGETGPEHWGDINPTCSAGVQQSPINIDAKSALEAGLDTIKFNYKSSPLTIVNNGHTIQANYAPGSSITVKGKTYELLQFHFHAPSEHTIDAKAHDMEVHLVHKAADGDLAVVGVMLDQGQANATLAPIWKDMPHEVATKEINGATINAADLLPKNPEKYYHYMGSLTTPGCNEVVNWYVMKSGISVAQDQVKGFVDTVGTNARPVQPLNRRFVLTHE